MGELNPEKLYVELRQGVTPIAPILNRHYTLTHSDTTAELFLTIGLEYAFDKVNIMRDEVLAEWRVYEELIYLYVYVYVGGYEKVIIDIRDAIFRRELPLALEAIFYGDSKLFDAHPKLNNYPIWIYFDSTDPNYNRFEFWGTPMDYKYRII